MKCFLPRTLPFFLIDVEWDTYPFRNVWLGFWMLSYDRSHAWYARWPHVAISWNAD